MICDNCKNKEICKHVEYIENLENKIKALDLDALVKINIKCRHKQLRNWTAEERKAYEDMLISLSDQYQEEIRKQQGYYKDTKIRVHYGLNCFGGQQ